MLSISFPPGLKGIGGGMGVHVFELSKALVKQGNDVHVITFGNDFRVKKCEVIDGIKVHRIYFPRIRFIGIFTYAFSAWFKLKLLIKNEGVDIIHYHDVLPDAFIAKFISKISKVQTEHSSGFLEAVEKGKYMWLYRWLLSHSDHVIGPSRELADTVIKLGVNANKTAYISNGVDLKKFNPNVKGDVIKRKYKINANEKVILCPRRLEPKNGVQYFIKAIPYITRKNNNVKCLIVGVGSEMDKLKNETSKLKITNRVIFTGNVPNSEMPEYHAASDIVVLPSLKEATSIAGLEAMASGKPLVGTNVGGIPQIITNNITGVLVPPKNSEALARAIGSLLIDDEKRIEMGFNARKRAENEFSWADIAEKTMKIYETVLKR
ncbi:Glycosyltransferase involved in cell wall bisynthesis [Methanophagales archaeon]|nr:Glycosyltransferase involved in cell wall bisynthesis [Methanophagales archaeon]